MTVAEQAIQGRPKSVILIGLGPTRAVYGDDVLTGRVKADHTWVLNMGAALWRHDLCFAMDTPGTNLPWWPTYAADVVGRATAPIFTSEASPQYPMTVTFPIQEVVAALKDDYFTCSVSYALAWALYIGVERLDIYGCDFSYPDQKTREEGSQSAAYWIGRLIQAGTTVRVCRKSTLLGMHEVRGGRRPLYGYRDVVHLPEVNHAHVG